MGTLSLADSSQKIGAYEVLGDPIAAGGLGRVYKVRSAEGKICAAKVLAKEFLKDRKKKERFCSEYHILSRLHSPRIVKAVDLVQERGLCSIILEYVDGVELTQLLKAAPFPEEVALHLVMEISLAFQECHKHQLFHRDLKPENILISTKGQVKLIDFGVAKDQEISRTLQGTVLGTLEYMAPEQIERTSHEVDQRADLYALGVLTYEMLSRRLPIRIGTNDSIIKVLEKKNKHKIPQGKIGSQVLENFCSILTHPDPEERPQNIEEVIDFIRKYKKSTTLKSSFKDWLAGYWESESEKKSKKVPGPDPKPVQNDLPPPAKERKSPYQWLLFWLPACLMFLYALSYSTPFLKKILGKLAPLLEQVRSFFHLLLFFFS